VLQALEERSHFFLRLDQQLGPLGPRVRFRQRALEIGDALGVRVGSLGLGSALAWRRAHGELASISCGSPGGEVRGIQAFTAQQRCDLARLLAALDLGQDAPLVLGGESTSLSLRCHFGVRGERR
jgi:hypothetical protein